MKQELYIKRLRNRIKELQTILQYSIDMIGVTNVDGYFLKINDAVTRILGYTKKEFRAVPFLEFVHPEDFAKTEKALKTIVTGSHTILIENRYRCKNGLYKWIDWTVYSMVTPEGPFAIAVGRDISNRKAMEEELCQHRNNLETLVEEKTVELEQVSSNLYKYNAALKILLARLEENKKEIRQNFLFDLEQNILPYLNKLKTKLTESEKEIYIQVIETNIEEIALSLGPHLTRQMRQLTPSEIQISDLIKIGKTNKEIADHLSLSPKTIASHRYNIRRKLSLTNKKMNLRTFLSTSKIT